MRCACIDIGSNTTALLVADGDDGRLRHVDARREFTLLGSAIEGGEIPLAKIDEVCEVVKRFADYARKLGAQRIAVVATHALREAVNGDRFASEIESHCGLAVRVLTTGEEARYSFSGATGGSGAPARPTAVIDAGGGSTEVTWCDGPTGELSTSSFPLGSSSLRAAFLHSDPPAPEQLAAARAFADETFAKLDVPPECATALAVGGGATTAREILGGLIDDAGVARMLAVAVTLDSEQLADRFEIEHHRARLLPAGLTVLAAISARLGLPLEVGLGGLREGVVLELLAD
ncbi:MAG: hypothetical protein HZB14_10770 [Actinobacteria bacterium]|nr:hypothetical protein [Actinomycetota bacterium]